MSANVSTAASEFATKAQLIVCDPISTEPLEGVFVVWREQAVATVAAPVAVAGSRPRSSETGRGNSPDLMIHGFAVSSSSLAPALATIVSNLLAFACGGA